MKQAVLRGLLGLALGAALAVGPAMAGNPEPAPVEPTVEVADTPDLTYYVSVFGGVITDQDFHEILITPWETEFLDSEMVGVALGFERPSPWSSIDLGTEVQLVKWFGRQDHWELNAMPIVGRYRFDGRASILRALSFGLGFSYASEVPVEEVLDDGESNRFMIYWAAEAEFGRTDSKYTPFIKLHHRSNAFGLVEEDAGSNTLALGLRRRF